MIKEIIIIIIVILIALIIFSIVKKLMKMAISVVIILIVVLGATVYLAKLDYENLKENFNDMDTLILLEQNGKYLQGLEKLKPIENAEMYETMSKEKMLEDHEMVIIISESINLENTFINKTSEENVKTIVRLKKQKKAEVEPEGIFFKLSNTAPIK
jgi:cation transport ATPase